MVVTAAPENLAAIRALAALHERSTIRPVEHRRSSCDAPVKTAATSGASSRTPKASGEPDCRRLESFLAAIQQSPRDVAKIRTAARRAADVGYGMVAVTSAPQAARLARLRAELERARIDALVVSHPPNMRYLTSFSGSAGRCCSCCRARTQLVVDFRYAVAARAAVAPLVAR